MSGLLRASAALVAAALLSGAGACPRRTDPFPELATLTDEQADARVDQASARRLRMAGTVKGRLPGIEGVVMSADLDVALEPRAKLSVAVRSFFEQPQQILVTDGETVTIFDATQGRPEFKRGKVDARTISKVLPIPLWPHEVVEVFLAKPPKDAKGRLIAVDEKEGTYTLRYEPAGDAPFEITVRGGDDAIVRWRHFKKDGRPSLDVDYGDLRSVGDTVMPFSWTVTLTDAQPPQSLVFLATDVTFNGPALPPEAFVLDPPANVPLLPL